jgi:OOP family OmpA-OmpF porin
MQWLVYRGIGLGFDASLMSFTECMNCRMALGSLDASYHFVSPSRRLVPFVVGGVGGVSYEGEGATLYNFGGGVNYWLDNGMALRFEVRDRFDGSGVHALGVRVGITF